ncbi:haloacid dehalogenase [Bifidobacterium sp. DSM 109958]|uniref:Haloacid dehalogenase n=1 Tax=Bifidobacterium moraviense TaxID=2675323 RepID=A0A7Y0HX33_9BIFI|nr:HAD-IIA family hydrolase [Bifidobacterium sp. DSM 109958]NMM99870.1 haloacid dehalogenase [Bifidobacterium sp. DSM 109958]
MTRFLKGIPESPAAAYQLALLDLDGVVYRGKNPVPHAAEAIHRAERTGMTIEYTTNNSSRFQHVVADQLRGFGLDVEDWQVITSSVVAARMVARHVPQGSRVLTIGAPHLVEEVRRNGLTPVTNVDDDPHAVIQGWYPDMPWTELAQAAYAVERGAAYFVTNRDLSIPREQGIAPGCGSLVNAVIAATGVQPVGSAGKPESAMYDEARMLNAGEGRDLVPKEASIAIGDRLDTDIEAGNRGGYDSMVVLTGVADPVQLMLAEPHLRPTAIARNLTGLNVAHPQPAREADGVWTCGTARARLETDGTIAVNDETSLDALRAACCLAWQTADDGTTLTEDDLPRFIIDPAEPDADAR